MDNRIVTLMSSINKLRDFSRTQDDLIRVKDALNAFFLPDAKCMNFIYTNNTDKLPFGCVVSPIIQGADINSFLIAGEAIRIAEYEVEIDSKLFDYGLSDQQIVEVMLYNIYHMIKDFTPFDNVREAIDNFFTLSGQILQIKNSVQYQAILALGVFDALNQVTSCLYLPNYVENDAYLDSLELDDFKDALDKIYHQFPGCENEATRQPKLSMLSWALRLYTDVEKERIPALHLLNKAKNYTASSLYIGKINNAINALNRIDTEIFTNEAVQQVFTESKKKGGLLASLKYSGLRDIEADLYEFRIRANNAESENDVMYALKQINARLAILEDYIRENPDDPELDRWVSVKMQYIEIRDELSKKKLNRHNYGIFVDYNALSDDEEEE